MPYAEDVGLSDVGDQPLSRIQSSCRQPHWSASTMPFAYRFDGVLACTRYRIWALDVFDVFDALGDALMMGFG